MMPWWSLCQMTERDLGAIYAYLRTVAPVENRVVQSEPNPGNVIRVNWIEGGAEGAQ